MSEFLRGVGVLAVGIVLPTAGCGSGAEDAVAQLPGVNDVKSCEDTGSTHVDSQTGDDVKIYRCTVQIAPGGSFGEVLGGPQEGGTYKETCFIVPDDGEAQYWESCAGS